MSKLLRSALAAGLALVLGVAAILNPWPVRAQVAQVSIIDFSFQPATITVSLGTTVTWTLMGSRPHTSTSDTGMWDSGILSNGQTFSHTFSQAGTFTYHCSVHPNMKGTVIVQSAAPPPASTTAPTVTAVPTTAPPTTVPTTVPTTKRATKKRARTRQVLAMEVNSRYVFKPAKITVKRGTTVIWKNKSDAPHTVTAIRGWKFDRRFKRARTLSLVFKKPGTYRYYCKIHSYMRGAIVVKR